MPLETAMRVLAGDLNSPTSLAFDSDGVPLYRPVGRSRWHPLNGCTLRIRG